MESGSSLGRGCHPAPRNETHFDGATMINTVNNRNREPRQIIPRRQQETYFLRPCLPTSTSPTDTYVSEAQQDDSKMSYIRCARLHDSQLIRVRASSSDRRDSLEMRHPRFRYLTPAFRVTKSLLNVLSYEFTRPRTHELRPLL